MSNAAAGYATPVALSEASFHSPAGTRGHALASGIPWWSLTPFACSTELAADCGMEELCEDETLTLGAREVRGYAGDVRTYSESFSWAP